MKTTVYVGIGSSIGNKKNIIMGAFYALQTIDLNAKLSILYENEAWGGVAKNMFINAVCRFETYLDPENLLKKLQQIEYSFGRESNTHWADRTLDLDILWYGTQKIQTSTLTIPHIGAWERDSVLIPLESITTQKQRDELKKIG